MQKSKRHNIDSANDLALAAEIAAYKAVFNTPPANDRVAKINRNDPSTWRRPNLDKLRASILEDWKGEAASAELSNSPVMEPHQTIDRKDPSTWKRPNLDNLKASILSDWKAVAA